MRCFPNISTLLVTAIPLVGSACSEGASEAHDDSPAELARRFRDEVERFNAETGARQITPTALEARRKGGEPVVFVDVREPAEQAVSTIPGAVLTTPATVSNLDIPDNGNSLIVTYCTVGYRSGLAAVELERRLGKPVYNLSGGIIAWFNDSGAVVDRSGQAIDRIHPYSEEWGKYVRLRGGARSDG